jgi:allantoin racemase
MDILVVNCNTSTSMTEAIGRTASRVARPGTHIIPMTPDWGVSSADGFYDSFISAAAVLERLTTYPGHFDGVVLAGYGEHGREGARQLLDVPVVDITEASAMFAGLVGQTFGVVTSSDTAIVQVRQSLQACGLLSRCSGVRSVGLPVLDLVAAGPASRAPFLAAATALVDQGAESIVMGCAGLTSVYEDLARDLHVPLIDGIAAGVSLCESLVHQGLRTSKVGSLARPDLSKARPGWAGESRDRALERADGNAGDGHF